MGVALILLLPVFRRLGGLGQILVGGQFAVAIFIERLEGLGRVRDLVGADDSVVVRIDGLDKRQRRRAMQMFPGLALQLAVAGPDVMRLGL